MKTRIISAIVMLLIFIPILVLGGSVFKAFTILLAILGMYELMNVRKNKKEIPIAIRIISYILVGIFVYFCNDFYSTSYNLDYRIFIITFLSFLIPLVIINDTKKYNINDALYLSGGVLFLATSFNALVVVRNISLANLLYVLVVTIMTDTFAYFTGYFVGKHKLCEKISPKKTIEGAIGGSIIATIIAVLFYIYVIDASVSLVILIPVTLLFTIIGQIGDLVFSSIKRYYDVKDFSNLIPGHGGILDRFDSILFVVITYILFASIL